MSRASGSRSGAGRRMIAGSLNRLTRKGRTASGESGPPRFISTTARRRFSGGIERFGEEQRKRRDMLRRRLRQDAVAEVEDKPSPRERTADSANLGRHRGTADKQRDGIEVALHGNARLQPIA